MVQLRDHNLHYIFSKQVSSELTGVNIILVAKNVTLFTLNLISLAFGEDKSQNYSNVISRTQKLQGNLTDYKTMALPTVLYILDAIYHGTMDVFKSFVTNQACSDGIRDLKKQVGEYNEV